MEHVIACEQVSYSYGNNTPALHEVTLNARKGSILGLLGHNGSGKSTLFRLLSGLLSPHTGHITFHGRRLSEVSRAEFYRELGIMIESPSFYDHLTVKENFSILCRYRNLNESRAKAILCSTGADEFAGKKAGSLSTGMRQRAGLAAALLHDPSVLILDEPTNGLDPDGVIQVRNLLLNLKQEGKTILLSSHMLPEMQRICDQLVILRQGSKVFDGDMQESSRYRDLEELYVSLQKGMHD